MRISITRNGARNQLACVRPDGTYVVADLGPNLPYHDLAHFVVEREFDLKDGFFGNIARGYSPAQLSDKKVILALGKEPYRAEILARALGSLATGACAPEQFEELVNLELSRLPLATMTISAGTREAMMAEFQTLRDRYASMRDGESLELEFTVEVGSDLQRPRPLPSVMRAALCTFVLVASHWALPVHGQVSSSPASNPPAVYVEMQADGRHCVIGKATVACSEVLTHLRQVLRLSPGTWIRFKAGRAAPFEAMKKLLDDVSHSEFTTSMAYLAPPKEGNSR